MNSNLQKTMVKKCLKVWDGMKKKAWENKIKLSKFKNLN